MAMDSNLLLTASAGFIIYCIPLLLSDLILLSVLFRAGKSVTNSPAPLAYRDVFVLSHDDELQDDVRDDAGYVTSPASDFVRALQAEQIPVCVLGRGDRAADMAEWRRRVADVVVAREDRVTVTDWRPVQGLERRVVVELADWRRDNDVVDIFRMYAVSRCTTQLITVNMPPDDSDSDSTGYSSTSSEDNTANDDETTT